MEDLFDTDLLATGDPENLKVAPTPPAVEKKDSNPDDPELEDEGIELDDLNQLETAVSTTTEENTDEEEELEQKDKQKNPESEEPTSSPIISLLAKSFSEEGLFSNCTEEELENVKDAKSLTDLVRKQIKDNEYADLNDQQKRYLEAIRSGVPAEYAAEAINNELTYSRFTPEMIKENADLRAALIKNDFLAKGYSAEKAEKRVKQIIDLGEDEEEALDALTSLKAFEQNRLAQAKKEADDAAAAKKDKDAADLQALQDKIKATESIIPGIKLPVAVREEMIKTLTTNVSKEPNKVLNAITQKRQQDPKHFDTMLAYLFNVTKGFTDFKQLVAPLKTSATKELDEKLKSTTVSGGNIGAGTGSAKTKKIVEAMNSVDPSKYL